MWKREEPVRSPQPSSESVPSERAPQPARSGAQAASQGSSAVNIGKSVIVKGQLSGSEDLTIEGNVEGQIELRDNVLTIGPNGRIKAEVFAKAVVIQGHVSGNVTATERVDLRETGSVEGDVTSPRVSIADGAHFRGNIDMKQQAAKASSEARPAAPKSVSRPAASESAVAASPAIR